VRRFEVSLPGIDLAANMIGRSNARRGARRIFAVLQNRRLNQHLAYTILDEVRFFFVDQPAIIQQPHAISVDRSVIPGGVYMTIAAARRLLLLSRLITSFVRCIDQGT